MANTLKMLRALTDPTRMRIMALLDKQELSVNELQEITHLGQSRISTHLGQLQEAHLVHSRREGKRSFYKAIAANEEARDLVRLVVSGVRELPEFATDQLNLKRILELRLDQAAHNFVQVAGRFDRSYGPGRSWQAFGHVLLRILPPLEIADLGSGEGLISELLALRAKKVIAVDNSERIVEYGAAKAKKSGIANLEFRLGDLEDPPIQTESVDLVLISQSLHHAKNPGHALQSAFRILRKGGKIMILDLLKHSYEQKQKEYDDLWPGFTEGELHQWLATAGFHKVKIAVVAREEEPPHFQTVLADAEK
jgi:ArsR family transcriptional regulator